MIRYGIETASFAGSKWWKTLTTEINEYNFLGLKIEN